MVMKRFFFALCALILMSFSCSKDDEETKHNPIEKTTWYYDYSQSHLYDETSTTYEWRLYFDLSDTKCEILESKDKKTFYRSYGVFDYIINGNIVTIKGCIYYNDRLCTYENRFNTNKTLDGGDLVFELHTNNRIMTAKHPESKNNKGFLDVIYKY